MTKLDWNVMEGGGRLKAYAYDRMHNDWSIFFQGFGDCEGSPLHGTGEGMVVSINGEHVAAFAMRYHGEELERDFRFDVGAYIEAYVEKAMAKAEKMAGDLLRGESEDVFKGIIAVLGEDCDHPQEFYYDCDTEVSSLALAELAEAEGYDAVAVYEARSGGVRGSRLGYIALCEDGPRFHGGE